MGATEEERIVLVRAVSSMTQLRLLDAVWTNQAQAASAASGNERQDRVAGLSRLVEELDTELSRLADQGSALAQVFEQHADVLRAEFSNLLDPNAAPRLSDAQRTKLRQLVDDRGGDFADAVGAATAELPERLRSERDSTRAEYDRLRSGEPSAGDFSSQVEADLALVAAGASAIFGPEAFPIVEGAAHAGELVYEFFHWLFG